MMAIRVKQHGRPEDLSSEDIPEPEAGQEQAIVKIEAVGVNFIGTHFKTGTYKAESAYTNGH